MSMLFEAVLNWPAHIALQRACLLMRLDRRLRDPLFRVRNIVSHGPQFAAYQHNKIPGLLGSLVIIVA